MSNIHSLKVKYKRTSQNGICRFIGINKEKVLIVKDSLDGIELIEGEEYLLNILNNTWFLYKTNQIGALENIVSIKQNKDRPSDVVIRNN